MMNYFMMRRYHASITYPEKDDTWDDIMEKVAGFDIVRVRAIKKADLLRMAQEVYKGVFEWCFSDEIVDENVVHKFTVKVIEMYHWRYNQVCGYGSNRQHQLWWWLDMDACDWDAAFRQDLGPW